MADVEMAIKLPEEVNVMISRVGLLRIPDEMKEIVDRAIQGGKMLSSSHGIMDLVRAMDMVRMTDEMRKTVDKAIQDENTPSNSREEMGAEDVLGIIHREGIETEVFKALSIWLINDREAQIREVCQQRATLKTIGRIVNKNPSRAEALNGVKAICESEFEEDDREKEKKGI